MKAPPLKVSQTCVQPSTCYCWAVVVWEEENEPNWNEWKHHCLECLSRFFPEYRMPLQTHTHTHTHPLAHNSHLLIKYVCSYFINWAFFSSASNRAERTHVSPVSSRRMLSAIKNEEPSGKVNFIHRDYITKHTHTHSLPCQGICECGIFVENLLNLNIAIAVCRWARTGKLDMKGKHWFLFYEHCTFKRWNELLFALSWNCACSDAVLFRTKWD